MNPNPINHRSWQGSCLTHSMNPACLALLVSPAWSYRDTVISTDYLLDIASRTLKAARTLHNAMWGKSFKDILETCGTSDYVPLTKLQELGLSRLGFGEMVLLLRQEYIKAFDALHLGSPMGDDDNVIITGHPGIGIQFLLITVACN